MRRASRTAAIIVFFGFLGAGSCWAVSFYPLPAPKLKGMPPAAEKQATNAVAVYATNWQLSGDLPGTAPFSSSGGLVTVESSQGKDYVVGAALNFLEEGRRVWEVHLTRRLPGEWGIQAGAARWQWTVERSRARVESTYTDTYLAALKSTKRKPGRAWAADVGVGLYHFDAEPGYANDGTTAFLSASYDVGKDVSANLSVWHIALSGYDFTRWAAGVGRRF